MKFFLLVALIFTMAIGFASAAPLSNVRSSALMAGDSAKFNLDFIDPFGLPFYDVMVKARPNNAASDSTIMMSHTDIDPRYLNTYEGTGHFSNPSGPIQFYGRIASDTLVMTQSYFNSANQFPPAQILYAPLAPDPAGDTMNGAAGNWLDLTGSAVTYSSTRLFVELSNAGGTWPQNSGFTTYFVYAVYLYNPDTLGLTATAMIYGNIPLLLTPGLYHVNLADTSFSRISSINSQVSSGKLHLACNLSDLQSDPNFPSWPPESGHVIIGGFTMTITLGTPQFNDYSYPSSFVPETGYLVTTGNGAPQVSNPTFDIIQNISVNVNCDYYDPNGDLPIIRQLLFDRGVFDMGSLDHNYGDTASFNNLLTWPGDGDHVYYFRFSDGVNVIETPMDTVNFDQQGVINPPLPITMRLEQNYPNPFNAETRISYTIEQPGRVSLAIYAIDGRLVRNLVEKYMDGGTHDITWNGKNSDGHAVVSGEYFYRLSVDNQGSETRRMILLK